MEFDLKQRGRALIDFEISARQAGTRLQFEVEAELARLGITDETLPDDMEERHTVIEEALADSKLYGARHVLSDYSSKYSHISAIEAYEEVRDELEPQIRALESGPSTLTLNPDIEIPSYYSRVWFHRSYGGWDAVPDNGFIHGEILHKKYLTKVLPGGMLYETRREIVAKAPKDRYRKILDVGASSGHFTKALADRFPDAEIYGVDLSVAMLMQAVRAGNERGAAWKMFVGLGEDLPFEDGSFDLVANYAMFHELPPRIAKQFFQEAYRVLEPGGNILMGDLARTKDLKKMHAWRVDWVARWVGEPYWRAAGLLDLEEMAREAGFVDCHAGTVTTEKNSYVIGTKPK